MPKTWTPAVAAQAAQITERIVYTNRCLGALLKEDDFGREDIETAVAACLRRGFKFPTDEAWFYALDYETAPPELKSVVDDLWVATSMRNGTRIENADDMRRYVLDCFGAVTTTPLIHQLQYPLEWACAAQALRHTPNIQIDEHVEVEIVEADGRITTLLFTTPV